MYTCKVGTQTNAHHMCEVGQLMMSNMSLLTVILVKNHTYMKIHKSSLTKSNDISLIHESSKFFFSYKTYLVHEAALFSLFSFCHQCMSIDVCASKLVLGSFLRVIQKCNCCNKETKWDSQPFVRNIPEGNLLMSAGILFTGCLPEPSIRMLDNGLCLY